MKNLSLRCTWYCGKCARLPACPWNPAIRTELVLMYINFMPKLYSFRFQCRCVVARLKASFHAWLSFQILIWNENSWAGLRIFVVKVQIWNFQFSQQRACTNDLFCDKMTLRGFELMWIRRIEIKLCFTHLSEIKDITYFNYMYLISKGFSEYHL